MATNFSIYGEGGPRNISDPTDISFSTQTTTPAYFAQLPSPTSTVPKSAVTSSNIARDATKNNAATLNSLTTNYATDQVNLQAERQRISAELAAAQAKLAELKSSTEKKTTTSRVDEFNATDKNGNRVYVANPSVNQGTGFVFDDPQYNPKSPNEQAQSDVDKASAQIDADLKAAQERIAYIASGADPAEKAMIADIAAAYSRRADALKQTNEAHLAGMTTAGQRSWRSRYAMELQDSILAKEEREGQARLNELAAEEQSAIAKATQAFRTGKYAEFDRSMKLVQDARESKSKLIQQQFENAMKLETLAIQQSQESRAEAKLETDLIKQTRDDAFADLDRLIDGGYELGVEDFAYLSEATGLPPQALADIYTQKYEENQLDKQKVENALSLQKAQIGSQYASAEASRASAESNRALAQQRLADAGLLPRGAFPGLTVDQTKDVKNPSLVLAPAWFRLEVLNEEPSASKERVQQLWVETRQTISPIIEETDTEYSDLPEPIA